VSIVSDRFDPHAALVSLVVGFAANLWLCIFPACRPNLGVTKGGAQEIHYLISGSANHSADSYQTIPGGETVRPKPVARKIAANLVNHFSAFNAGELVVHREIPRHRRSVRQAD
jgi:hypothetical protein